MRREIEKFLAIHCAPVLYGRKPAALVQNKLSLRDQECETLRRHGLRAQMLSRKKGDSLLLIYHPALLTAALSAGEAVEFLSQMGYPVREDLDAQLCHLRARFDLSDEFPHEVGFFLGYPPEDVLGFIRSSAECKLRGPWKVYGDIDKAAALFEEYALCRRVLVDHIERGGSIFNQNLPVLTG